MRKYVTYKRVSTEDQGRSGLGLAAQDRDIKLFFEAYAEHPFEVIGEFVEVETGKADNRPELARHSMSRGLLARNCLWQS